MANLYIGSFVSGNVSTPNAALGAADGVYTTDTGGDSWTATWRFEASPGGLAGTQTLTLRVQADSSGGAAPTIDSVNLLENGTLVRTLATAVTVGFPDVDLQYTFDATEVSDPNLVEIQLVTSGSGGSPSVRRSVQLDGVHWDATLALTAADDEIEDATSDGTVLSGERRAYEDITETAGASAVVPFLGAYSEDYYAETYYVLGTSGVFEDIADDVSSEHVLLTQLQGSVSSLIDDADAEPDLTSQLLGATSDILVERDAADDLLLGLRDSAGSLLEDTLSTHEVLTSSRPVAADLEEITSSDTTVLYEEQTKPAGEEYTEQVDREDTILQQLATFTQDVEDVATHEAELVSRRLDAVQDVEASEPAYASVVLEQPFYVVDTEVVAQAEATALSAFAAAALDALEDVPILAELGSQRLDGAEDADEETLAEGYGSEVQSDDILEEATAAAEVPIDPVREDIYEWVWPRARIAGAYADDVEEELLALTEATSKLRMDIAVDIDALAEVAGEQRGNSGDRTATADGETLYEAAIHALASLESEAYLGGAVTYQAGSFYNGLIEDADGGDELTQRLLVSTELAVDADGRADVAGTAWFKAHSFIEEATGSSELLTELVRRPTKDDVAADATGNSATLAGTLHAWAAWSEDALAEAELLGNESGTAWVFNTRTMAFSRYVDFEASQVATVNEAPLAAGARGVMAYTASRAEGFVKTGLSDYGAPQLKRIRHAYITAASQQPLALSTLHGIGDTLQRSTYQIDVLDSTVPYTHRLNLARGDQGQFWAFELRAPAGPPTTLLNLRIIPLVTSRRI